MATARSRRPAPISPCSLPLTATIHASVTNSQGAAVVVNDLVYEGAQRGGAIGGVAGDGTVDSSTRCHEDTPPPAACNGW